MFSTKEDEMQKRVELDEAMKEVGLYSLSYPLIIGLLIYLKERYKRMNILEKCMLYRRGVQMISKYEENSLEGQMELKLYDSRFYQPWRAV